jgi:hypothetical protein
MDKVVVLAEVRPVQTPRGNTRWVSRDADGNEYVTFREVIGHRARELAGRRVRIQYHSETRGAYTNVYLDSVEPAPDPAGPGSDAAEREAGSADADPDRAAWQTAVPAAPWLVGEANAAVPPKRLYDKLKPFEEYVAADIEEHQLRPRADEADEDEDGQGER